MQTEEQILFSLPLSKVEPIFKKWLREVLAVNPISSNLNLPDQDQYLSVKDAAKLLNLAVPTIYSMVSRRELPYMKRRQRLYFSRQELTAWVRKGKHSTLDEINSTALASLAR